MGLAIGITIELRTPISGTLLVFPWLPDKVMRKKEENISKFSKADPFRKIPFKIQHNVLCGEFDTSSVAKIDHKQDWLPV